MPQNTIDDLVFLKRFCGNDPAKMKKYIGLYISSTNEQLKLIPDLLLKKEWNKLKTSVHCLKPQFGMLGFLDLEQLVLEIESMISSNKINAELNTQIEMLIEKSYASVNALTSIEKTLL